MPDMPRCPHCGTLAEESLFDELIQNDTCSVDCQECGQVFQVNVYCDKENGMVRFTFETEPL